MSDHITSNIEHFGFREVKIAEQLFKALHEQNFPSGFEDERVRLKFDRFYGQVYFTNINGQKCMMNEDELEMYYELDASSFRGFYDALVPHVDGGFLDADDAKRLFDDDVITLAQYRRHNRAAKARVKKKGDKK